MKSMRNYEWWSLYCELLQLNGGSLGSKLFPFCGTVFTEDSINHSFYKLPGLGVYLSRSIYFTKIQLPFYLKPEDICNINFYRKTPADILKQTRERLENDLEQNKESSYGMFLRFLGMLKNWEKLMNYVLHFSVYIIYSLFFIIVGTFLRKNQNDLKYWNQMKGRIFSKLTKGKVKTFSEAGMYNFISLFLTLAVTVDTESVVRF